MEIFVMSGTAPIEAVSSKIHHVATGLDEVCICAEALNSMVFRMRTSNNGAIATDTGFSRSVQIMIANNIVWNATLLEIF
jgi:hypothetical protein